MPQRETLPEEIESQFAPGNFVGVLKYDTCPLPSAIRVPQHCVVDGTVRDATVRAQLCEWPVDTSAQLFAVPIRCTDVTVTEVSVTPELPFSFDPQQYSSPLVVTPHTWA